MRRFARIGLATVLLVGGLAAGRLSLAGPVVACSCVPQEPDAPLFSGREQAVIIGTVGAGDGSGIFPFAVERWFRGGEAATIRLASATLRLPDGSFVTNTCGAELQPGWHVIIVATLEKGVYTPSPCQPFAGVETAQGQRAIQAAIETFGGGSPPGEAPDSDGPAIDLAAIAIVAVAVIVSVVLLGGLLAAFGRRDRSATP